MERTELKALLEAIIYVSEEPVTLDALAKGLREVPREEVAPRLIAGRGQPRRRPRRRSPQGRRRLPHVPGRAPRRRAPLVRSQRPPLRLSMPALETLAVIAYKQPATGPEIHAIRGVDCSSALATLLEKGLIVTAGRKQCVGRPILYRTSKEFLLRFGLSGVDELPTLKEFEELARAALGDVEMPPTAEPPAPEPAPEENPTEQEHA
jgi:segregation and condensation protein B